MSLIGYSPEVRKAVAQHRGWLPNVPADRQSAHRCPYGHLRLRYPSVRTEVLIRLLGLLACDRRDIAVHRLALEEHRRKRANIALGDEVLGPPLFARGLAFSSTILFLRAAGLRLLRTTITPAAVVL